MKQTFLMIDNNWKYQVYDNVHDYHFSEHHYVAILSPNNTIAFIYSNYIYNTFTYISPTLTNSSNTPDSKDFISLLDKSL